MRTVVRAFQRYIEHQSANQAGSVAFSAVLSMFPLLILVSAAAAFVGRPGDAAALADRVISFSPPIVQDALKPVVDQVLRQRSQALLAIGLLATLWTASSGMQAVRTALNKAYEVREGLSFWKARIKVTLFTIVAVAAALAAFSSVVILPYAWQLLERTVDAPENVMWLRDGVRYGLAYVVLAITYAVLYAWLPDISLRVRTVVPGALAGAALWIGAAALLSYSWRSAGKLLLVYGSVTGFVAMLVFLYVSAATLIFGAEINSVLRTRAQPRERR